MDARYWDMESREEKTDDSRINDTAQTRKPMLSIVSHRLQLFMTLHLRAGVAETVRRRATGWTDGIRFPAEIENCSLL
jgi:hypothetical protein